MPTDVLLDVLVLVADALDALLVVLVATIIAKVVADLDA